MKKLYITIGLFVATLLSAQVPQAFSYQTIAFNSNGAPVSNGNVSLRVSILENSNSGTVLYTETHNKTTNSKGLVNLNIGEGTPTIGNFGGINWGANTKFVKVELDPQGGSNYVNVGVNQLMSVPYAQISKTVVTGAGQGITLLSPNGTPYVLSVNDNGSLNLPTTSSSNTSMPLNIYMYGSYNNFTAASAELLRNSTTYAKIGYKYLPSNTQIKFLAAANASAQVYGVNGNYILTANGGEATLSSNGFYKVSVYSQAGAMSASVNIENIAPQIQIESNQGVTVSPMIYNTSTNKFSCNLIGVTSYNFDGFKIKLSGSNFIIPNELLGDNLNDGNFDVNGAYITISSLTATPKNFKLEFNINFDATGSYTITEI